MLSTTPRFARNIGLAATMAALAAPAGAVARPSPEEQGVRQAQQSAAAPADRGPTRSSEVGADGVLATRVFGTTWTHSLSAAIMASRRRSQRA